MIIPSYFTAQEVVPISNEHEEGAESIKELGQPTPHTHPHLFGSHQEGKKSFDNLAVQVDGT